MVCSGSALPDPPLGIQAVNLSLPPSTRLGSPWTRCFPLLVCCALAGAGVLLVLLGKLSRTSRAGCCPVAEDL